MSTTLASKYDVIICGASIAGCATARALSMANARGDRRILLFDLHKDVSPRFSGEMIHPRGARVLDELGFTEALEAAGGVEVDGFVVLEDADAERVELPYATIPGGRPTGFAAHHKTLVRVMRRVVSEQCSDVDLVGGLKLVELLWEGSRVAGVVLEDESGARHAVRSGLVVGADGKASTVRKLAGVPEARDVLGFTAGLELVDAAVDAPHHATVVLGAPGPMLVYPIARDGEGRLVSRLTFDLPHALPAKGPKLAEYLIDAFVPYLPESLAAQTALALRARVREAGALEMAPTVNLPAPPATAPGLVLVGDAAGCSHPITASGMTMGLLDAQALGREARRRARVLRRAAREPWLDERALRRYRTEHERYVPTRQALADAIYEAFRGEDPGARAIRRALFAYWHASPQNRRRSLALLACDERRPHVFLSEYLKAARHAVETSLAPKHATHYPVTDRLRSVQGAVELAGTKLGLVAQVALAQVRPAWL